MVGGVVLGVFTASTVLNVRMSQCAVGGRRYQTFVYQSTFPSAAITGRRASAVLGHILMSLRNPVRHNLSCGASGGIW